MQIAAVILLFFTSASFAEVKETTAEPRVSADDIASLQIPKDLADLKALEQRVTKLIPNLVEATVSVQVGFAVQGSGVIIGSDGYVLTAAHVSGRPHRRVRLVLSDGRTIEGETLGRNEDLDAGLIKITEAGNWPHVEMATDDSIRAGDWCLGTGHPGGYDVDRPVVVRLGRILAAGSRAVRTDCTLTSGDSGGPLFDLNGNVIGIHSRIGMSTHWNLHVPIAAFRNDKDWNRLVAGESWGGFSFWQARSGPILGIDGKDHEKGCEVTVVNPIFPAGVAGLKPGDVITHLDGEKVNGFNSLKRKIGRRKGGDEITIVILREGMRIEKEMTLASR